VGKLFGATSSTSAPDLTLDDRVALFAMDYAHRQRLKIFGRARIMTVEDDPSLAAELADPKYQAKVERAIIVNVEAFDWNCPQHITPRSTADEMEPGVADLRHEILRCEPRTTNCGGTRDQRPHATELPVIPRHRAQDHAVTVACWWPESFDRCRHAHARAHCTSGR
jgi:hypothetical protein